jgi:ABC-2 type transport system permease protein
MSMLAWYRDRAPGPAGQSAIGGPARYINLTRELALTNFKLKYTGSMLGYLWSLMKPLMYFGVLYIIFVDFFKQRQPEFPMELLLAIVIYTFFSECTSAALGSIAGNAHLVRKAYFPLSSLVVSQSLTALLTMAINLTLVTVIGIVIHQVHFGPQTLLVPLLVAELYLLSLGVGMLLASAYVFYRDLGHVWEVLLQVLLYGCGVVFPATAVPRSVVHVFFLNPLAQIIEDLRHAIVTPLHAPWSTSLVAQPWLIALPAAISVLVFVAGLALFRALNPLFAESL